MATHHDLTLYVMTGCPYCIKVKRFLADNGVTIPERNISTDAEAEQTLIAVLSRGVRRPQATMIQRPTETTSHLRTSPMTTCNKLYTSIQRCRKMSTLDADVHV